jgi:RNA polymerase sigma-32 factor
MAGRFRGDAADYDDLVQEANLGLILAARHFEPNRGTRFASYASWWIEARLRRFLAHRRSMIKVSEGTRRVARRLLRAEERLLQQGRSPTVVTLARAEDIALGTAQFAVAAARTQTVSLDRVFQGEDDRVEAEAVLASSMDVLTAREREVLEYRYYGNLSYEEIAAELSLSASRVRQLEAVALGRLRRSLLLSAA